MPIPQLASDPGPRKLLSQIVAEKMIDAIMTGTLVPGERISDAELESWLQVSRTPIRQAIAQLESYGLVEVRANRFTCIASLDDKLYAEASQLLSGLHDLGEQWGLPRLDAGYKKGLIVELNGLSVACEDRDLHAPRTFLDIRGQITTASENNLLVEAEKRLRLRVQFLSPRHADACDWDALSKSINALHAALSN